MSDFVSKSNISNIKQSLINKISPSGKGDKFATFTWRGQNSWEKYRCLILNSGSDLKWSNSGSIKNTYSNSMYELNKTLLGVSVDVKSITLKLGLFVIDAEEYRKFLYWMDPMAIDRLEFSTDTRYYYYAKLSNIGEATKWVIGKDENGEELYYVELSIGFELQGDNYAYGKEPNIWNYDGSKGDLSGYRCVENGQYKASPLRNNIIINIPSHSYDADTTIEANIYKATWNQNVGIIQDSKPLFKFTLSSNINATLGFQYNSRDGVILIGDQLLSLLTKPEEIDSGEHTSSRVLSSYECYKFSLPSKLQDGEDIKDDDYFIQISIGSNQETGATIYSYDKAPII